MPGASPKRPDGRLSHTNSIPGRSGVKVKRFLSTPAVQTSRERPAVPPGPRAPQRPATVPKSLRATVPPGALNAFAATGENAINYIVRHMNLDPGVLAAEDQLANLQAVRDGTRVFSAYELRDGTRIWLITEADRSATTILLPEEY